VGIGRKRRKMRVPLLTPRVEGSLLVEAPDESYPGEKHRMTLTFTYEAGDLASVDAEIRVNDSPVNVGRVERGGSISAGYEVTAGLYDVEVRVNRQTLVSDTISIARLPPEFEVVDARVNLSYPEGGTIEIVYSVRPRNARVRVRRVEGPGAPERVDEDSVEVDEEERVIRVKIRNLPPVREAEYRIIVEVVPPDGQPETVEATVKGSVGLSEESRKSYDEAVNNLLSELGREDVVLARWLQKARALLARCKREAEPYGYDCSYLEVAISDVENEIKKFAQKIAELPNELKDEQNIPMVLDSLLTAVENCRPGARYEGTEGCQILRRIAADTMKRALELMKKKFEESDYEAVEALGVRLRELCRTFQAGVEGVCREVDRILQFIDELGVLLENGIFIYIPPSSRDQKIRTQVIIKYSGTMEFEGVYVDFSPSGDYIRELIWEDKVITEKDGFRIRLPRIVPDHPIYADLTIVIRHKGKIPLRFRVCYKNYCVDHFRSVVVGAIPGLVKPEIIKDDVIASLVGRPVHEIRKMAPAPKTPRRTYEPPVIIGQYKCVGELGRGGLAVTMLCYDKDNRQVVLKVAKEHLNMIEREGPGVTFHETLREGEEAIIQMFENEASAIRKLEHKNIVKLLAYDLDPIPHLVFEYCTYGDVQDILGQHLNKYGKPFDPKTSLEIMIPVGDVINLGHAKFNLIHLDIKPSNVLIDGSFIPKISDYNISVVLKSVSVGSRMRHSILGGTEGFAAPEQFRTSLGEIGEYSDVFGHAATLYYIMTKQYVYDLRLWKRTYNIDPTQFRYTPARKYNEEVVEELDEVLEGALAIRPIERRYHNMAAYLKDLAKVYKRHYASMARGEG